MRQVRNHYPDLCLRLQVFLMKQNTNTEEKNRDRVMGTPPWWDLSKMRMYCCVQSRKQLEEAEIYRTASSLTDWQIAYKI